MAEAVNPGDVAVREPLDPDAEDVPAPVAAPEERARGLRRPAARPLRPYELRFSFAYLALSVVVAAALVAFAVIWRQPERTEAIWSAWQPTKSGVEAEREIADYVANRYRLASGNPVGAVFVAPRQVQGVELSRIVVRTGQSQREIRWVDMASTTPYTICGLGQQCSIAEGKPSRQRGRLVRREALELALYSFRYLGRQNVVALLPAAKGQQPQRALFLERKDFARELSRPLRFSLAEKAVVTPQNILEESARLDRLTRDREYRFSYQGIPDGTVVLVLTPPEL